MTNASVNASLESGGDIKRQKVDSGHGLTNAQNNLLQNNAAGWAGNLYGWLWKLRSMHHCWKMHSVALVGGLAIWMCRNTNGAAWGSFFGLFFLEDLKLLSLATFGYNGYNPSSKLVCQYPKPQSNRPICLLSHHCSFFHFQINSNPEQTTLLISLHRQALHQTTHAPPLLPCILPRRSVAPCTIL